MTLAVIPARGGSTELRRKNLLPIGGVPAVLRTAHACLDAGLEVIVSTDDATIAQVAAGFPIHWRGPELAESPVDRVVATAVAWWSQMASVGHPGDVLLVQPTVQPIEDRILARFVERAMATGRMASLAVPERHLLYDSAWGWLAPRVNRQDMEPTVLRELGVRWWPNPERIWPQGIPDPVTIDGAERLVDIDTADDWHAAQPRKTITFGPISDKEHGRGHLHRCLAIAERLQRHDVRFHEVLLSPAARHLVRSRGWSTVVNPGSDLYVADNLGRYDPKRWGLLDPQDHVGKVLSLEDPTHMGDRTINALYEDGAEWDVIRPEFIHGSYTVRDRVERVMVMFGGTDPSQLGRRISRLLLDTSPEWMVDWIGPGADVQVAARMRDADLLITSAGRTVIEAATVGVPTIVLAQNLRETTHTHLGYEHGNVYLGLGKLVSDTTIVDTVRMLAADQGLRRELSERGRPDGKGLDRIVHVIEGMLL